MVGCKGAEHILAVNTDPEAAIIQKADWAVIADLHEVVPAVTDELKSR
jgi:electron transfer flavoprotein alpha subunit